MIQNVKRGEIYTADIPKGKGSEQSGDRPVLIVQDDQMNISSTTTIVVTITSKLKKVDKKYHILLPKIKGLPKQSMVEAEQVKTIDKVRLIEYRCTLDEVTMRSVDRGIKYALGLKRSLVCKVCD